LGFLEPKLHVRSIYALDLDKLWDEGFRGILLDLDNTFVPYGEYKPIPSESMRWLQRARDRGFKVALYSNASRWKVEVIREQTGMFCVHKAIKPFPFKLKACLNSLGLDRRKVVTIGDQLFTDILGGNLFGMYTILVDPIHDRDFLGTKILRFMERIAGRKRVKN
jgi:hypothetical protein